MSLHPSTNAPPNAAIAAIILAAGMGTRMKSALPKVMHPIAGRPMVNHVINAVMGLANIGGHKEAKIVVVIGPDMAVLEKAVTGHTTVQQTDRLGTAHAVEQAKAALGSFAGDILILNGDGPFITTETLQRMITHRHDSEAAMVVLGFRPDDATGYGRMKTDDAGNLLGIVEHKDADNAERAINLCNSGIYSVAPNTLFPLIEKVSNDNLKSEYYLTDIVEIARAQGLKTGFAEAPATEVLGINSRSELSGAERIFQDRARLAAMDGGVTLIDPTSVWFSADTVLGRDVVVHPNVVFGPGVVVEDSVDILAFSHLEGAHIRSGARIGPYARLRPGADIGENARIGNFVEVKNVMLEKGAKANHLSYLGDGSVGAGANIGAGTIFCNYDGFNKARTEIGPGAFIGSNTALVAPVSIGKDAIVGAGSVITKPVPDEALSVARGKQTDMQGRAPKLRAMAKALKEKLKKQS